MTVPGATQLSTQHYTPDSRRLAMIITTEIYANK